MVHTHHLKLLVLFVCCSVVPGSQSLRPPSQQQQLLQQQKASGNAGSAAQPLTPPASTRGSRSTLSSEVLRLPGLKQQLPSQHFAGYVTVDDTTQRQLFYYLVTREGADESSSRRDESSSRNDDTPLIIWLTGGPGCSSLDAFTYENGPFIFSAPGAAAAGRDATLADIQLNPNPHSWSKTAHMVYIDSPAGTGFSYTPGEVGYYTSDDKTIEDLVVFVAGFFDEHPWLVRQPLYVAGESYGGVYVPLLARALLRHNERVRRHHHQQQQQQLAGKNPSSSRSSSSGIASSFDRIYNIEGYVVGNAVTDDFYDFGGQVDFAFSLGLIDPDTFHLVKQTCKANEWHVGPRSPCADALDTMESVMGPINQYDILGKCYNPNAPSLRSSSSSSSSSSAKQATPSGNVNYRLLRSSRRLQQQQQQQEVQKAAAASGGFASVSAVGAGRLRSAQRLRHAVSCADRRYASVYYNSPEVRRALHAESFGQSYRWEPCSDVLHYTHSVGSMIPIHMELQQAGLRGLVLSGDHDYVVPYTGTRAWVYDMRLEQSKPWHPWSLPGDDQVAGYAVEFRAGLTFATVKGGGHMVPQTHPQAALALLQQWMEGRL